MSSVILVDFQFFELEKPKTTQMSMHTKPLYITKKKFYTL